METFTRGAVAADHARFVAELREDGTLEGRPVERWREEVSEDGEELRLIVVYTQPTAPLVPFDAPPVQVEVFVFSKVNVDRLESGEGYVRP